MSTESNILFDVYELFIKEDDRRIVKVGNYYIPSYATESNIRLFRYIESPAGQVDLIFCHDGGSYHDKDLCVFLGDPHFLTLATNTVATFEKEELYKASRIRLGKFHDLIRELPCFDW